MPPDPDHYTQLRIVAAEGARIGVLICRRCGAAVVLDPSDKFGADTLHDTWHAELAEALAHGMARVPPKPDAPEPGAFGGPIRPDADAPTAPPADA